MPSLFLSCNQISGFDCRNNQIPADVNLLFICSAQDSLQRIDFAMFSRTHVLTSFTGCTVYIMQVSELAAQIPVCGISRSPPGHIRYAASEYTCSRLQGASTVSGIYRPRLTWIA